MEQAVARNAVMPPSVELLRQQSRRSRNFRDVGAGFKIEVMMRALTSAVQRRRIGAAGTMCIRDGR